MERLKSEVALLEDIKELRGKIERCHALYEKTGDTRLTDAYNRMIKKRSLLIGAFEMATGEVYDKKEWGEVYLWGGDC